MAKKHTNIGELRSSLALVVKMLANKGIKVTQVGIQAFVEYDERTLEAKRVNIPSISDQSPPELVTAIKGFVDHEVAHLLFTDAKIIERAHKERIANLHNIVEDTFIERKMKNAFAGSTRNIDKTLEFAIKHFFQRSFDKHIKGYDTEADDSSQARFFVRALATPGIRALSGQEAAQEFMADKWELIPEVYEGLAPLAESLESINSSLQSLKLANTIREILADVETNERKAKKEKAKKADPMEKPSKPSESDDGEEGDEGDDAPGATTGESKSEESEGYSGDSIFDEPEKESEEKPEKSDGSDCEESTEKSDHSGGSGSSSDSDDEPEESEDDGDSDGESDSEEEGDEEADASGSSSSGDSDEEGEAEDSESDGDDDAEGEPDDDDSDWGSFDDEDGDDDDDFEGDDDEDESRDKKSTTDKHERADSSPPPTPDFVTNDGTEGEHEKLLEEIEKVETYDSALESVISDGAASSLEQAGYMPFSSEKDVIETFKIPTARTEYAKNRQRRLREENSDRIGVMSKSLERLLVARNRSMFVPGFRSGRLHSAGLYKLQTGDTRVFRRKEEIRTKNTAVMLLVDCSGSMNSRDRIVKAGDAAYALCHALERINIKTQVMGFTTGTDGDMHRDAYNQLEAVLKKNPKFAGGFDRVEPLFMPIFKSFDERLTPTAEMRVAAIPYVSMRNNADGESVEIAGNILRGRQEERKIMIVLSDGQPAMASAYTSYGHDGRADEHLKNVVTELESVGIETLGIGIETHDVKQYYPKHIVIDNVSELPTKIITELSAMLLN